MKKHVPPSNPLYSQRDNPVDGVASVHSIMAYLEDMTNNLADLQMHAPEKEVWLTQKGINGQMALFSLMRQTLEQTMQRTDHS